MKFLDEYRDPALARRIADNIKALLSKMDQDITIMEVCGTHTMSIARAGLRTMFQPGMRLLSGPGCPVCVTPNQYLDRAVALSRRNDVIVTTFGDMMRVPGSSSNLYHERAQGADVKIVYSPLDALNIARENSDRKVVFLAVGFETTAPTIAATIKQASNLKIDNFYALCGHKLVTPAMKALVVDPELNISGFLCPGHVSVIIGERPYDFLTEDYHIPCVIAGFEPVDVLEALLMLARQISGIEKVRVQNEYSRTVKPEGNLIALSLMDEVFETMDTPWRGLGTIPMSGYGISEAYRSFDAESEIEVEVEETREHPGCICGSVLRGIKIPTDCILFKDVCHPGNPVGPCMVSTEGTCAAYFKYG